MPRSAEGGSHRRVTLQIPTAWFFEGLPPTDAATKTDLETGYAAGAVQALLSTADGLALAQLLSGLETRRRRGVLDLMSILAEPLDAPRKVA